LGGGEGGGGGVGGGGREKDKGKRAQSGEGVLIANGSEELLPKQKCGRAISTMREEENQDQGERAASKKRDDSENSANPWSVAEGGGRGKAS